MADFRKENYRIIQNAANKNDPNFLNFMSEVDFICDWVERRIPTSFTCKLIARQEGGLWELGCTIQRLGEKFDISAKSPQLNDLYPAIREKFKQWITDRRLTH